MTPERWQQVKEIFQQALEREPSLRSTYLAEACSADPSLREEVELLLAFHQQARSCIETPAIEAKIELLAEEPSASMVGKRMGAYQMIGEIGQGGMGTVYSATRADDQYQKQVAIKLVRRGMDTDFILQRFRNERQILASLDHPNVARLLDGGVSDDGLPYFVMEYIQGHPIHEYCDAHSLPIEERLKLFRTVCLAVHYAHQNLVVHRDIKPSNILVTADGVPKLLDFGIAKILKPVHSEQTQELTVTAQRVMTPEYACPEQVRGEPITTATDVYLLGIVLYELLTGHQAYRFKSRTPEEMAKVICEKEPERPSTAVMRVEEVPGQEGEESIWLTAEKVSKTREGPPEKLRRRLAGDLDTIVLKAIHKEPQRRYASVEQLSEDIRRHLEGLPVIARKNTLGYRTTKFIRRNIVGVSAAALVLLSLLAGIVATVWEARVAQAERARAERRFNDVRKLANSFLFEFHDAIENLPGSTPARELLVKRALEYLDSLAQEAKEDPSLQRELATAYEKVGDVQGQLYSANLGNTVGAWDSYRKALAIREALAAADPKSTEVRFDLSMSYAKIGSLHWVNGNPAAASESYRKALVIDEQAVSVDPANAKARHRLAKRYSDLGYMLAASGDAAGGLEYTRKAVPIFEALLDADPSSLPLRDGLATAYMRVGAVLEGVTPHKTEALEMYRKALRIQMDLSAANPTDTNLRRGVAASLSCIGDVLAKMGGFPGALESYRRSQAIFEALSATDLKNEQFRQELATLHSNVGRMLAETGNTAEAVENLDKALAIFNEQISADPTNAMIRFRIANSHFGLGKAHSVIASDRNNSLEQRITHWRQARLLYQRSLDVYTDLHNRGSITGDEAAQVEITAREIARCDAALVKLEKD